MVLRELFFLGFFFIFLLSCSKQSIKKEGDRAWVMKSTGKQCEAPLYPSIEDATEEFTSRNIEYFQRKSVFIITCMACGCPNSENYAFKIDEDDLTQIEENGWSLVTNEEFMTEHGLN